MKSDQDKQSPLQSSIPFSYSRYANHTMDFGFSIDRFLELDDWKILELTPDIPFSEQTICPSDGTFLTTMCTLIGVDDTISVRLGCCAHCGYMGYIDRPTQQWITSFYKDTWDNALAIDIEAESTERRKNFLDHGIDKKKQKVREKQMSVLLTKFPIIQSRPVLDIGCGYGAGLKFLEELGFNKLYGVENSEHRAAIASKTYGMTVYGGAFESEAIQAALQCHAPFGFIFSHHVMEHVYNPSEIIERAASLQQEGDYLLISLPNANGEPAMMTALFLPHLHSFTRESFAHLLAVNGYSVVDDTFTRKKEIFFLARKEEKTKEREGGVMDQKKIFFVLKHMLSVR